MSTPPTPETLIATVLNLATKRRRKFLDEMERVVPRANLVSMIAPYARQARPPAIRCGAMLCIHFMQQWFTLSDPAWRRPYSTRAVS